MLAVPGPVSSVKSQGCHRLIQDGAKLVQRIEDILVELPPEQRAFLARVDLGGKSEEVGANPVDWTDDEREILIILDGTEPVHLDELADRVPLSMGRLQSALFGLELRGAVEQSPGGYYLLRPQRGSGIDGSSAGHR